MTHILDLPRNSDSLLSLSLPQTSEIQVRNHSSVGMNRGTTYNILNMEKTGLGLLTACPPRPGSLPGSFQLELSWNSQKV